MDATSPSPDNEGIVGLHNLIADKIENLRLVQEVRKDLQHRYEQRRLGENAKTQGSDAPLPVPA